MLATAGKRTVGYGLFLLLVWVFGYPSDPLQAKTALVSGTFGGLSILWGILMMRGSDWAPGNTLQTPCR